MYIMLMYTMYLYLISKARRLSAYFILLCDYSKIN